MQFGRVGGCVYLYIGCYQHIIAYLDDIVVYKRTVHVDDNLITDENVLPVFAMEIFRQNAGFIQSPRKIQK